MRKQLSIFLSLAVFANSLIAADLGPTIVGAAGSIFLHESGHSLTTLAFGGEVLAFKPYPVKVKYQKPNGEFEDKWVGGLVKQSPFEGEFADQKNATVAAMGSVGNFLSVFALAPLLPTMSSDFAKESLDSLLFFSSFDWAAYVTANLIFPNEHGDWSKVAEATGVSLYWYLLAGVLAGYAANEYRYDYHKRAFDSNQETSSRFSVGFSFRY